jgi:hypothetical protein
MRLIVFAQLILLTATIATPAWGHVLMPWSYQQRQAAAQIIVIAEPMHNVDEPGDSKDIIQFRVLSTLKGPARPVLRVWRSTMIAEEKLSCCEKASRYILFLRRGNKGLYQSVHGDYGAVRLAE